MIYFNGFYLKGEEVLFKEYIHDSAYSVAGFSYGAQQALEYVLHSTQRIERLVLLSPAFFQNQNRSFVRTQLRYFQTGKDAYVKQFLQNVASPSSLVLDDYLHAEGEDALNALLLYEWEEKKIKKVLDKGVTIEVFVGEKDKIVSSKQLLDFFAPLVVTYCIKNVGHLLR